MGNQQDDTGAGKKRPSTAKPLVPKRHALNAKLGLLKKMGMMPNKVSNMDTVQYKATSGGKKKQNAKKPVTGGFGGSNT